MEDPENYGERTGSVCGALSRGAWASSDTRHPGGGLRIIRRRKGKNPETRLRERWKPLDLGAGGT